MMTNKKLAKKLALEISKQDKLLKHRLQTGSITEEDIAILSDIRDYFMLSMLKCKNPKDAETLVSLFEELGQLSDTQGDHFHEGFFFA
ncbi:MAG: hypothetical protein HY929_06870, partial [Euryarchaeota archaeon]|nr:hypothetical protein [Euryarchaeota archaeon]